MFDVKNLEICDLKKGSCTCRIFLDDVFTNLKQDFLSERCMMPTTYADLFRCITEQVSDR